MGRCEIHGNASHPGCRICEVTRIELAGQHESLEFAPEIRIILDILGYDLDEVLVTDLSRLCDFDVDVSEIAMLCYKLDMTVSDTETLVGIAARMRAKHATENPDGR